MFNYLNFYIGTAGWDYKDWIGTFYPKNLKRDFLLGFYSNYFNIIEVNSTFYKIPQQDTCKKWRKIVPSNFIFIVKAWKKITHEIGDARLTQKLREFSRIFEGLYPKLKLILFQFSPWFGPTEEDYYHLLEIKEEIPKKLLQVYEFRNNSWFKSKKLISISDNDRIIIATTYLKVIKPFYFPNQARYYIRLIGDRQLNTFSLVQRKQDFVIFHLLKKLEKIKKQSETKEVFIIVNNHFTGFAPETANHFKKSPLTSSKEIQQSKNFI